MKTIRTLKLIFLLSVYCTSCVTPPPASPKEIPFKFMEGDTAILVPAKIGSQDAILIFDTGAGIDVIAPRIADDQGIGPTKRYTGRRLTNEPLEIDVGTIPSISFADQVLNDWDVATHEYFDDLLNNHGIHGLLSLRMFRDRPVTIDYPGKTIVLETSDSLKSRADNGNSIPIYTEEMIPNSLTVQLDFLVDGKWTQKAMIDTGSAPTKLPLNFFDMLGLTDKSPGYKEGKGKTLAGFDTTPRSAEVPGKIAIGSAPALQNSSKPVRFDKTLRMGSIGGHFFSDKVVTFDIANRRIIVRRSSK